MIQSKIPGPLLDRIDIQIAVLSVKYKELRAPAASADSAAVRTRVTEARKRQLKRFTAEKNAYSNAPVAAKVIRKHCAVSADGEKLLENAVSRLPFRPRRRAHLEGFANHRRPERWRFCRTERGDSVPNPGPVILGLGAEDYESDVQSNVTGRVEALSPLTQCSTVCYPYIASN